MTRRVAVLATIATITSAWPALDEKLQSYPSIHARETAKIKAGDAKNAKYILFDAFHGLGNRETHEPRSMRSSARRLRRTRPRFPPTTARAPSSS
jgi:hypothetical protein